MRFLSHVLARPRALARTACRSPLRDPLPSSSYSPRTHTPAPAIYFFIHTVSASKTRALRHTATHAALALLEGVGARATSLAALSEAATKESERARTLVASLKTAAERNSATKEADDFVATAASYETELAACDGAARSLFEGVVAVRYRDVCAGIRADTMIALGSLMAVAPARFLSNANLKCVARAAPPACVHLAATNLRTRMI